jgi:hypothetical protein
VVFIGLIARWIVPRKVEMEKTAMIVRILASLPVAAVLVSVSFAAGSPADYNGDGKLSREDFRNEAARVAFSADKNKDGTIESDEYKLSDAQVKGLDENADGKVSVEEFQVGQMKGFDQLDKNNDGFLDAGELGGGN